MGAGCNLTIGMIMKEWDGWSRRPSKMIDLVEQLRGRLAPIGQMFDLLRKLFQVIISQVGTNGMIHHLELTSGPFRKRISWRYARRSILFIIPVFCSGEDSITFPSRLDTGFSIPAPFPEDKRILLTSLPGTAKREGF
jgi:hypothetical protein